MHTYLRKELEEALGLAVWGWDLQGQIVGLGKTDCDDNSSREVNGNDWYSSNVINGPITQPIKNDSPAYYSASQLS